ncbi:uncharacterized protein LOC115748581 [Rhodamnia argentea]|uniref:Uncharacterized protein LOC115748581 n=1 Tax=Rhodamnia argentea TaxID=178133 RepID=A0A8B8Q1L0_9MYRT|nr:uncharacterized protein LOC115748581 [Rhodamnia argentea]
MLRLARPKPLTSSSSSSSSSLDSLAHQFLQRCSVSRTAKGKSKLKAGQPLKRSRLTTKKSPGPSDSASKGGGGGKRGPSEAEALVEACLKAPTPLRYLTDKQRAREAEREKMGLIGKDRQREIDILKKGKSNLAVSDKPEIIGTPGLDLITLGLVDADKIPKYELTVEDGRRLAKEYSRLLMRRHRARQAAESNLLRMKKEAIEALPEKLREAALVPDLTPFPANRFMATLTPPIEGYIEKVKEAARKSSAKEKLR